MKRERTIPRFPDGSTGPADQGEPRTYSEQQKFISRAWQIFDDVGAARPEPALLMRFRRRLFRGDSEAMLYALDAMADAGQISHGLAYFCAVISARVDRGEFAPPPSAPVRTEGELTPNGKYFWRNGDWEPVHPEQELN